MEQFKNLAETTLDTTVNNSTTTVIATDGSVFPSSGNFRIKMDSEIMLCTSRSSNTLTVTRGAEGSTAASHTAGVKLEHVWTAGGYEQSLSDLYQQGGYSSRPSSGIRAGTEYYATDVDLNWKYNGSSWDLIRPTFVPNSRAISLGSWTALNHSTETWTDVNGVITVDNIPASGGDNIRGYHKAKPSAPYTLHVIIEPPQFVFQYTIVGFGLYDSGSGKLKLYAMGGNNFNSLFLINYNSTTSFNADVLTRTQINPSSPLWLTITDDNTNWIYKFSQNGKDFVTYGSETRNTFLTPDKVFFGFDMIQTTWTGVNHEWLAYWET